MKRPNEPKNNASQEEWLKYWKDLRVWAREQVQAMDIKIKEDQQLVREAEKRIRKLQKVLEAQTIDWMGKEPVKQFSKEVLVSQSYGLVVTSTTGGVHSPTSYHYQGRAVDVASGSVAGMKRAQGALLKRFGASHFKELFGPCNWYIKNGVKIQGAFPDHSDHVHIAK